VRDGTDETYTIRLPMRRVNTEMRTSFFGHHISATFELRGGAVKAAARRVERSESLDDAEHSSILIVVMADFWRQCSLRSTARSARDLLRVRTGQHAYIRRADHSENHRAFRHGHRGVSNPPGRGRCRHPAQTGGLLTPPLTAQAASADQRTAQSAVRRNGPSIHWKWLAP
jgi:hypothetical protein